MKVMVKVSYKYLLFSNILLPIIRLYPLWTWTNDCIMIEFIQIYAPLTISYTTIVYMKCLCTWNHLWFKLHVVYCYYPLTLCNDPFYFSDCWQSLRFCIKCEYLEPEALDAKEHGAFVFLNLCSHSVGFSIGIHLAGQNLEKNVWVWLGEEGENIRCLGFNTRDIYVLGVHNVNYQ